MKLAVDSAGTTFTYQGVLTDSSGPLNGSCDLTFTLYDSPGPGGNPVPPLGSGSPNPNTKLNSQVSGGLVTTTLDFGPSAFTGGPRWLEITVHDTKPGGATTTLSPRQQLTPLPYAIYAENAATVASGSVVQSLNGLKDNVTLAAGANVTLTPSGNTLTIASAAGGTGIWSPIAGGGTYYNGGNVGIGTSVPDAPLTLAPGSEIKIADPTTPGWGTFLGNDASGNATLAVAGHDLKIYSGFENVLQLGVPEYTANGGKVIIPGGNVGIGTASPSALLNVVGTGILGNTFQEKIQSGGVTLALAANPNGGEIQSMGGQPLYINHNGNPVIFADNVPANVGIGTANPDATLEVVGNVAGSLRYNTPGAAVSITNTSLPLSGFFSVGLNVGGENAINAFSQSGNSVSIATSQFSLDAYGPQASARFTASGTINGAVLELRNDNTASPNTFLGAINFNNPGRSYPGQIAYGADDSFHFTVGGNDRMQILNDGTVSVPVLQINGADVAEPFDLSAQGIPKGSVMVIDEEHAGQLKLSDHAYDARVAGILSGANGVHPGIRLKQEGFNDHGEEIAQAAVSMPWLMLPTVLSPQATS